VLYKLEVPRIVKMRKAATNAKWLFCLQAYCLQGNLWKGLCYFQMPPGGPIGTASIKIRNI
jgi:hypothetical protein